MGDITYIATNEGWLLLAAVMDLFSRQVVGWLLRHDMTRDVAIDALHMARFKRRTRHASPVPQRQRQSVRRHGLSKKQIHRCLKRYIASELYPAAHTLSTRYAGQLTG